MIFANHQIYKQLYFLELTLIEEYRELAEYAYQRYVGLVSSDDDYVWETVSQRLEQYRDLFEKIIMNHNKRSYK